MSNAELLDTRKAANDRGGHTIQIAHVRTKHGVSTVRSERPDAQSKYFFIGGLVSGGSYELAACSAAHLGNAAHTLRHGNNSARSTIEADADEVVDIVEMFGKDGPVHLFGHSKAGRVVIKAAARLGDDINLASMTLINPALSATNMSEAARGIGGVMFEQFAVNLAHPLHMARAVKGSMHEIRHRPLGVIGETLELLNPYDFSEDMKEIKGRGTHTTVVIGGEDHLVNKIALEAEAARYEFDQIIRLDGAVGGSHFGIVVDKKFLQRVLPPDIAA